MFAGRTAARSARFSILKRTLDEASGVTELAAARSAPDRGVSKMQDLGIRNEVVQAVLNHAVPGVGGVYLRSELEKQKAEALATWAAALTKIVGQRVSA